MHVSMARSDVVDFPSAEFSALREEMREVKHCQLQYFTLAILAAGAILGTNGLFGLPAGQSVAVLAPLLVILPCWVTFFDKATTITRMAAYVRLVEEALSASAESRWCYKGFENSLRDFRHREDTEHPLGRIGFRQMFRWDHLRLLTLRTRHRYWVLNWWTFLLLAVVCSVLPFALGVAVDPLSDRRAWLSWLCVALVGAATLFTLWILVNLNAGCYSYDNYEKAWRKLLAQEEAA